MSFEVSVVSVKFLLIYFEIAIITLDTLCSSAFYFFITLEYCETNAAKNSSMGLYSYNIVFEQVYR